MVKPTLATILCPALGFPVVVAPAPAAVPAAVPPAVTVGGSAVGAVWVVCPPPTPRPVLESPWSSLVADGREPGLETAVPVGSSASVLVGMPDAPAPEPVGITPLAPEPVGTAPPALPDAPVALPPATYEEG